MKTIYKIAAALCVAAFIPTAAMWAQNDLRSAYFLDGSINRHQMNPAFASERNYVGMPVLGNLNAGAQSNIGVSDLLYEMPGGDLTTFMNQSVDGKEFLGNLNDRNRLNVDLNMSVISFGLHKWGGFNTFDLSVKSGTRVNLPKDLFEFAKMGMKGGPTEYNLKDVGVYSNSYAEIAFGHSRQIMDKLRVGAKVKFLLGIYNADFRVDNMNFVMSDEKWRVSGSGKFSNAGIVDIPSKMKTRTKSDGTQTTCEELDFDNIDTGDAISGFGMAFDFGATCRLREDLELSAALLDLGWIRYKDAVQATTVTEPWEFGGFQEIPFDSKNPGDKKPIEDQIDDLEDDLEDLFQMKVQGKGKHAKALGATLNLGALYTFPYYDKLKFGFLESTRINGQYSWTEGRFSANVAPVKCFDASVSYAVSSFGSSLGWVANYHGRGFSIFLGSNHQFFKVTPQCLPVSDANMNVSIGINFPFGNVKSL